MKEAIARLGTGPLTEEGLREHIWPLFSRVLQRDEIYLANHSLGRPLDCVEHDVLEDLRLWYERMDDAWDDDGWPAAMKEFRSLVARLIGQSDPGAVVPKTSAGQGLRAVLNALPGAPKVLATRGEFDSIDFILKTYQNKGRASVTWVEPDSVDQGIPSFSSGAILRALDGQDLLVVSAILFSTGQVLPDLKQIIEEAHAKGVLVLVDAYHAAGVVPLSMDDLDCDFMVGGSYKYTRGGPGACWLAINPRHLGKMQTLDTGWFAKKSPFSYARPEVPEYADGGDGWLESTPPVLTLYQAKSGLSFTVEMGVDRLRDYNLKQQAILKSAFAAHGVPFFDQFESMGAYVLVPHPEAKQLCTKLKSMGVNTDSRGGAVRFGPDILNSEAELRQAAGITAQAIS